MMTPTTVPKTDAQRDHAFTLDTGETVVVNVAKLPTPPSADAVAVLIQVRMVDPATGETEMVGGSPVKTQGHTATVLTSALGDGMDFGSFLADEIERQAQRVRGVKAGLLSLAGVAAAIQTAASTSQPGA